jgi:hypothetical protein
MEDGVAELALGLSWVITSSAFLMLQVLPSGYIFAAQAIWVLSSIGMAWGTKKLKERVAFPRGGYVALDDQPMRIRGRVSWRTLILALGLGICVAGGAIAVFSPDLFTFSATGLAVGCAILFAGIYTVGGLNYRMPHLLWLGAFCAVLAAWAYARNDSIAFVLFWQGVALAVAGGIRLGRFIKSHPKSSENDG